MYTGHTEGHLNRERLAVLFDGHTRTVLQREDGRGKIEEQGKLPDTNTTDERYDRKRKRVSRRKRRRRTVRLL